MNNHNNVRAMPKTKLHLKTVHVYDTDIKTHQIVKTNSNITNHTFDKKNWMH